MEIKTKNNLDLLKKATEKLNGVRQKAFLGSLIYVLSVVLLLSLSLIHYAVGFIGIIFVGGILTVNYIRYIRYLLDGKVVKLEMLFNIDGNWSTIMFLSVLFSIMTLLGGIMFIIPGLLVISYYSMSLYVIEKEKSRSVFETMNNSANIMNGKKIDMLSYKIFFYVMYLIDILVSVLFVVFLNAVLSSLPVLSTFLIIVFVILNCVVLAYITMWYYACNNIFFNDITKKDVVEKSTKKVEVEKVKVENDVNNEKVVEKTTTKTSTPATKKTPAKKRTTTKK